MARRPAALPAASGAIAAAVLPVWSRQGDRARIPVPQPSDGGGALALICLGLPVLLAFV